MLPSRPLTDGFALVYAHDPALDHSRADFEDAYRIAVETLDFGPLTSPGQTPTRFHFRPLKVTELRKMGSAELGALGPWIAFRLALESVDENPAFKEVKRGVDPSYPGLGPMLVESQAEIFDQLPRALGRSAGELINDMGSLVLGRSVSPSPK